jgi:hypothetical protein
MRLSTLFLGLTLCCTELAIEQRFNQSAIAQTNQQMNELKREGVPTVLPKYLPSGFRLINFKQEIQNLVPKNSARYFAFYKGPNRCEVVVSGANGGFGAGMVINPIVVNTSLFGKVTLETKLDGANDKPSGLVAFTHLKKRKFFVGYVVNFDCSNRLFSSQEAIKILKSLYIKNP